ncbi:Brp/Blh family beta-carotene 15,15'-dioxygenase [Flavobacterium sp.]|uniref:Brp/Blh family beta-carotene 15,15'-dioxygenase n=1 Tax=Flavobacterium sp. TaxID=239 RepID=UPI00261B223D|nr:Brp/Blh family beta-carotene 15,15'-dioxygenase [Flavobacterium sp.]MDG2431749.1 Brp/Blh family beta-carotene 15,15'-dioxygenase [Flavobacterium sp.]
MLKYTHFAIVASFFCLWLNSFFTEKTEIIIAFAFIFTIGILHGANDLILIKNSNNSKKSNSFQKNLVYYIIVVLLGLLLFYFIPILALLLFIIVSAFHFGDQQGLYFKFNTSAILLALYPFLYGILILFLLFFFHAEEVNTIVSAILRFQVPTLYISEILLTTILLFLSITVYFGIQFKSFRSRIIEELFYLLVFAIIFKTSTLLWGFAIYFIIWHSVPSIIEQMNFMYGSVTAQHFKTYLKNGFMYWLASILGIALLYFLFNDQEIFNALFFSFLAAITFPHVLVILNMMHNKERNNIT